MTALNDATIMAPAGVTEARTPKGETVLLVTDPDGDWFIVEQLVFGGGFEIVAHVLAPADRVFLKADTTLYARIG